MPCSIGCHCWFAASKHHRRLPPAAAATAAAPAAATAAGRVCYWELVDAELVHSFQAHESVVCGVAAHPTESCLLTCSVDGTVKVWR